MRASLTEVGGYVESTIDPIDMKIKISVSLEGKLLSQLTEYIMEIFEEENWEGNSISNDDYRDKLIKFRDLAHQLMRFKVSLESPHVDVINLDGVLCNILMLASDFVDAELERLKEEDE